MSSWFSRKKDEAAPPLPASLTAQGYNAQPAAGAAQNAAVAALQENFVAYTEQVNGCDTDTPQMRERTRVEGTMPRCLPCSRLCAVCALSRFPLRSLLCSPRCVLV